MFNSLFGSFQNTVAEAKEEREQLDRLLTISTPRERLLVAAIAVALIILASWLLLGSVARSFALDGALVDPGENRLELGQTVQALVWVEADIVPQIMPGMPVAVELTLANGEFDVLDGEVATISAVPFSDTLTELEAVAPVSVYRMEIALEKSPDLASLADRRCRIIVEFDRQSPIELLRMRRS